MAEDNKSYRIRTKVGQEAPNVVNVQLDQTYDTLEILSLKINQQNDYNLYQSDKGIVVGRVLANGGLGIPNAKISIFIPTDETMELKKRLMYPYESTSDSNSDRVRYNLLSDYVDDACHQNVGTFPNKRYMLDNKDVVEIFDRFWKYTTTSNQSGDFCLYGIPTGSQSLHVDVDLSDIGLLSQTPRDLMYKGFNQNLFDSPTKFKKDVNLNSLAQIKSQDVGIYVYPFWGDSTDNPDNIAITRCDINIDYKFEPTCVFMGSIITDTGSNAIGKNCAGTESCGKMSELVSGEGSIQMIRKTIDNKIEQFQIKGDRLIDGDGVWCYQIPMNLDYVMTDEFGNLVPTDNPDKGIPTRARVRFRISLDKVQNDNSNRNRCQYLVPNNPRLDSVRFPEFTADEEHKPDYEFGSNTREESFCDLFWNKVYSVKNYIPRIQKNNKTSNRKHTGIKLINHYGDNNPMPYNNMSIKFSFQYRFICVLVKIFIELVSFLNNIITIIGAVPCLLYELFDKVAGLFETVFSFGGLLRPLGRIGRKMAKPFDWAANLFKAMIPSCMKISSNFCGDNVTHKYTFYPGCGCKGLGNLAIYLCDCVWDVTSERHDSDNNGKDPEEWTLSTNNPGELENCVEAGLAEDNDTVSFNFQNDWINGVLYAPLWYRKITPKKKFLFGLFSRKAKDQWCSVDHSYGRKVKIFQPCAVERKATASYGNIDGEDKTARYMDDGNCSNDCHEMTSMAGLYHGVIVSKETMLGQKAYYYTPVEYDNNKDNSLTKEDANGGCVKLLFATDIILLGSMNDCDLNGVPQFFKSLESTTYKLPSAMLFTDNIITQSFESKDGKMTVKYEGESTTEMTGQDWGNSNDDILGEPDGGLFYGIGCNSAKVLPKSCINLSRICEYGVTLDESKEIVDYEKLYANRESDAPKSEEYTQLRPDGFISKDELYNDNERSMFATLNGNELRTKLNNENGLKEYDFRHIYVDNFDNSLSKVMADRQKRCSWCTYKNNYNLEWFSRGYYEFRMGRNPYFYDDKTFKLPRYENSFYFYFGLKSGKTALEKFNSQFFAECYNTEDVLTPIKVTLKGNSWCSNDCAKKGDGYVAIDLSNVSLPCDILIQNSSNSDEYSLSPVDNEKIYIASSKIDSTKENELKDDGYVKEGRIEWLPNGSYKATITDSDGEISEVTISMYPRQLSYDVDGYNFKMDENSLLKQFRDRNDIGKDNKGLNGSERNIGGTINIYNVADGLTGDQITTYGVEITGKYEGKEYGIKGVVNGGSFTKDGSYENEGIYFLGTTKNIIGTTTDTTSGTERNIEVDGLVFGVPVGDISYTVKVTEYCGTECKTGNEVQEKVKINYPFPFKLFINDIDYDLISDWGTGWNLESKTEIKDGGTFSENWLHISDKGNYKWNTLTLYKKEISNINSALSQAGRTEWKLSTNSNISDEEFATLKERIERDTVIPSDLSETIIASISSIENLKDETISKMKSAFWLTCENETKDIRFTSSTDYMPVTYHTVYRPEIATDDGETNTLDGEKVVYSDKLSRIDDIVIPTISSVESEGFGGGTAISGGSACYARDNNYDGREKEKEPYFVCAINSNKETIPIEVESNDDKAPINFSKFFGFHIIDKIFNMNYLAWAPMNGIPFYLPDDGSVDERRGKFTNMNGLFAAKILNGITEDGKFKEASVGIFDMDIVTLPGNDEDSVPTNRFVAGGTYNGGAIPSKYQNFENYIDVVHELSGSYNMQYVPILPVSSSSMRIEDYANCYFNEDMNSDLAIELKDESIDYCKNKKKDGGDIRNVISVEVSNFSTDVNFYIFKVNEDNPLSYPLNAAELRTDKYVIDCTGRNTIFDYNVKEETFKDNCCKNTFETEIEKDDGTEETEVSKDGSELLGYGTTGKFVYIGNDKTAAYYIIAATENNCRAISPAYWFGKICCGFCVSVVQTKMEGETVEKTINLETGEEVDPMDIPEGVETETVSEQTYDTLTDYAAGFFVKNIYNSEDDNIYYLNYYSYEIDAVCNPDDFHSIEVSGIAPPQLCSTVYKVLYKPITKEYYDIFSKKIDGGLFSKAWIAGGISIYVKDVTGLKHTCCLDSLEYDIMKDTANAIVFRPNGGYWGDDPSDNGEKTIYLSSSRSSIVLCTDDYGEPKISDENLEFDFWREVEDPVTEYKCGMTVSNEGPKIFVANWIIGEGGRVDVTFVVSDNGGHWADDGSTDNYVMNAVKSTTVTCDRYPYADSLDYGFVGWSIDKTAATGTESIEVGEEPITVYAIYAEKECLVAVEDISTDERKLKISLTAFDGINFFSHFQEHNLSVISSSSSSGGIWEYEILDGDSFIEMSLETEYNDEMIRYFGTASPVIWRNGTWYIDDVNKTLQSGRICFGSGEVNVTFVVSANNGKWFDDGTNSDYTVAASKYSTIKCDRYTVSNNSSDYGFVGWSTDSGSTTGSEEITVGDGDMTLYAIYVEKECHVILHEIPNGVDDIYLEANVRTGDSGTNFEWFNFDGSCTEEMRDGVGYVALNGLKYNSELILTNMGASFEQLNKMACGEDMANNYNHAFSTAVLYADGRWRIDEINELLQYYNICYTKDTAYTVRFVNYNGDLLKSETVVSGGTATPPEEEPTRSGYKFIGWDKDVTQPITEDITFVAKYEEEIVDVTDPEYIIEHGYRLPYSITLSNFDGYPFVYLYSGNYSGESICNDGSETQNSGTYYMLESFIESHNPIVFYCCFSEGYTVGDYITIGDATFIYSGDDDYSVYSTRCATFEREDGTTFTLDVELRRVATTAEMP